MVILSITVVLLLLAVIFLLGIIVRMRILAKRTFTRHSTGTVTYTRHNSGASYKAFDDSIPTASGEGGIPVSDNEAYGVTRDSPNTPLNAYTSTRTARLLDYTDEDELYI